MTQTLGATIIGRLRDADYRGPLQHLRGWSELDRLHDDAAARLERLARALEGLLMAVDDGRVEHKHIEQARAALAEALGTTGEGEGT